MEAGGTTKHTSPHERIADVLRHYWGYDTLRPLQAEAIDAGVSQRDSLVVLPTGGGKSLCYQVPPAVTGRTDIVVSPLISLMKDQVDGLRQCGYPAAALHSGLSDEERRVVFEALHARDLRLLLVAPERLMAPGFLDRLGHLGVRAFAIDEAHCISHWGHDFRPEYRQLAVLKARFPNASVHAYTATATQRVRDDIVAQLHLQNPAVLVGTFDRPNLVYRVIPRVDVRAQVAEILQRHARQAAIVYCITRKETEYLANGLAAAGVRAAHYHAGLEPDERRDTQERFAREQLDVVVATVAFGMGIDRSDVRCVIHAALPKSIEHYQQETGRAGRDGLEAECVLLYSPADAIRWEQLITRAARDAGADPAGAAASRALLLQMRNFAANYTCRHRLLAEYFGQSYQPDHCGACDFCLDEGGVGEEATELARKILSCVARVEQRFGIGHVVKVLTGAKDQRLRAFGHDQLTTFGLLAEMNPKTLTNLTFQLIEQGLLDRTDNDRPLLKLNAASWAVLRGARRVRLVMPKARVVKAAQLETDAWEGVDRALFESLRDLRRTLAAERGVPAYLVFGDATLRDLARRTPRTPEELLAAPGVGPAKLRAFGQRFLAHLRAYATDRKKETKSPSDEVTK